MRNLAFALLLLLPLTSCAQPSDLEVKDVWTRQTAGNARNAAVYMTIKSPTGDRLVAASASVASKTDLMTMEAGTGSTMGMEYLNGIDLPANTPVGLNSTGLHVWLADLKQPLKAGETFALNLRFAKAGERQVIVSIIKPTAAPPNSGH